MRHFEMTQGTTSKFWAISIEGQTLTTTSGRIGTTGQRTVKPFTNEAAATAAGGRLVAEKLAKGYVERKRGPSGSKSWPLGSTVHYSMRDFDVNDDYAFVLTEASKGALHVDFGHEAFDLSARALESATAWFGISQLSVHEHDGRTVPPFVLSRAAIRSLQKGEPTAWQTLWSRNSTQLRSAAEQKYDVTVDGAQKRVEVLRVESDGGLSLVVLDDAQWPFVLSLSEGDNEWALVGAKPVGKPTPRRLAAPKTGKAPGSPSAKEMVRLLKGATGPKRAALLADFAKRQGAESLLALLASTDHTQREVARDSIATIKASPQFKGAVATLLERALDESRSQQAPYVRSRTVGALHESLEAVDRLRRYATDEDSAASALVKAAALDHPCDFVRGVCASVAIDTGDAEVCGKVGPRVNDSNEAWRSLAFSASAYLPFTQNSKYLCKLASPKSAKTEAGAQAMGDAIDAVSGDCDWLETAMTWRTFFPKGYSFHQFDAALEKMVAAFRDEGQPVDERLTEQLADTFCATGHMGLHDTLAELLGAKVKDPVAAGLLRCLVNGRSALPSFLDKPLRSAAPEKLSKLASYVDSDIAFDEVAAIITSRKDAKRFASLARAMLKTERASDDTKLALEKVASPKG